MVLKAGIKRPYDTNDKTAKVLNDGRANYSAPRQYKVDVLRQQK